MKEAPFQSSLQMADLKGLVRSSVKFTLVLPSTVRDLDYLESNGTVYKRRLTPIVIANNNRTFKHTHAWMYIGLRSYWDSRKGWLEQIPAFKPKLNDKVRYYTFLPEHEQSK